MARTQLEPTAPPSRFRDYVDSRPKTGALIVLLAFIPAGALFGAIFGAGVSVLRYASAVGFTGAAGMGYYGFFVGIAFGAAFGFAGTAGGVIGGAIPRIPAYITVAVGSTIGVAGAWTWFLLSASKETIVQPDLISISTAVASSLGAGIIAFYALRGSVDDIW